MEERISLQEALREKSADEARQLYDNWASTYERENLVKGYRTPWMGAALMARHQPVGSGPLLDAGCGTGLVGEALSILGYGPIIGCDVSPGMMALAAERKAYADLVGQDMAQTFAWPDGHFAGFTCIGCYAPGHAPADSLAELVRVTRPGGIGVFSLLDANLDARGFGQIMRDLSDSGRWRILHKTRAFRAYVVDEPELMTNLFVIEVLDAVV